jgi:hypothetical protein
MEAVLDHGIITSLTPTFGASEDFEKYANGTTSGFSKGYGWDGPASILGIGAGSVTTGTRAFITGDKKYLELPHNAGYARTFAWGSDWTKIRIGILLAVPGSTTIAGTALWFGVGNGNTDEYYTNANWIGFTSATTPTPTQNWQFQSTPSYYKMASVRGSVQNWIAGFQNSYQDGGGSGLCDIPSDENPPRKGAVFLEINKNASATDYGLTFYDVESGTTAGTLFDTGIHRFFANLDDRDKPETLVYTATSGYAIAASESPGILDTLSFSFRSSAGGRVIQIYAIGAVRLY